MARPPKECEQPGCHNRHNARGMCKTHYSQWMVEQRNQKLGFQPRKEIDPEELWEFVKKELKLA